MAEEVMKKIGIIGFGNMGSAIAERLRSNYQIYAFDKDKDKTKSLSGIKVTTDAKGLVEQVDVLILAVKPQDFDGVLNEIKDYVKGKLIISIAAGIRTRYIEKVLGEIRVIRAMPNISAKIGHSVTCLCKAKMTTNQDMNFAKKLFKNIGEVRDLTEEMMNAATAISGSGPGYYFDAIESNPIAYKSNGAKFRKDFILRLTKAAKSSGFDDRTAKFLAHWTVVFSDLLLDQTGSSPAVLRKQVTSKGGTTEAALDVLHKGGSLVEAVKAAVKRAKELSRG